MKNSYLIVGLLAVPIFSEFVAAAVFSNVFVDHKYPVNGSDVTFTCEFSLTDGDVLANLLWRFQLEATPQVIAWWRHDKPDNVTYNAEYDNGAYQMTIHDINVGQTALTIDPVKLHDEGRFWCSVVAFGNDSTAYKDINVTVSPSSARIFRGSNNYNNGDMIHVMQGTRTLFNCITEGVKPAATLSWTLGGSDIQPDNPQTDTPNGDLYDSVSTLALTPGLNDHSQPLKCTASTTPPFGQHAVSTEVQLYVQVPPTSDSIRLSDKSGRIESLVIVKEGTDNVIVCDVSGTRPAAEITWEVDGTQPGSDFEVGISSTMAPAYGLFNTTSTLTLKNAARKHHRMGIACMANISVVDAPPPASSFALLDVYGPPDRPQISGNTDDMTEGTSEQLICTADNAYPEGNMQWFKNDINITRNEADNNENSNGRFNIMSSLIFNPNRNDDRNTIKCNVSHKSLRSQDEWAVSVVINVKYSPEDVVVSQSPSGPIVEDGSVTLTCSAGGNPSPDEFMWFKGEPGEVIGDTSDELLLLNVKRDERGPYTCKAKNTIEPDGVSDPVNITIYYPPENVRVEKSVVGALPEGEDVTLICSAEGNPSLFMISWYKNEQSIPGEERDRLMLTDVTREEAGYYKCKADNNVLSAGDSASVEVIVHYSPEVTNKDDNVESVDEGQNAKLICITISHPEQNITWYTQSGEDILNRNRTAVDNVVLGSGELNGTTKESVLSIFAVVPEQDYGIYTCEVSNIIGTIQHAVNLSGLAIPHLAKNVEILQKNSTTDSLVVQWEPGHDGGVKQWFLIQYHRKDGGDKLTSGNITAINDQNIYTHKIINLYAGTTYLVYVSSGNIIGNNINKASPVEGYTKRDANYPLKERTKEHRAAATTDPQSFNENAGVPTYAVVDKKTKPNGGAVAESTAYLNCSFEKDKGDEDTYDDVANVNVKKIEDDGKTVSPDGLIYQEVGHLRDHPKEAPPIQTEASTEYASLDFNRMKVSQK